MPSSAVLHGLSSAADDQLRYVPSLTRSFIIEDLFILLQHDIDVLIQPLPGQLSIQSLADELTEHDCHFAKANIKLYYVQVCHLHLVRAHAVSRSDLSTHLTFRNPSPRSTEQGMSYKASTTLLSRLLLLAKSASPPSRALRIQSSSPLTVCTSLYSR